MKKLKELLEEENNLIFDSFSEHTAWELGNFAREILLKQKLPVALRIEKAGQILFQTGLPGSGPDNDLWLTGKIRVVNHFRQSSFYISRKMIESKTTLEEKYLLNPVQYRDKGGAVPLFYKDGSLAAVLAISGLEDHLDHSYAVDIIKGFLER